MYKKIMKLTQEGKAVQCSDASAAQNVQCLCVPELGILATDKARKPFDIPFEHLKYIMYGNPLCNNPAHLRKDNKTGLWYNRCLAKNTGSLDDNGLPLAWVPHCNCGNDAIPLVPFLVFQDTNCCGHGGKKNRICNPFSKSVLSGAPEPHCSVTRAGRTCNHCHECLLDPSGALISVENRRVFDDVTPAAWAAYRD